MVSPFPATKAAGRLRSRPVQCAHWAARGRLMQGSRPALTGAARRLTLPQAAGYEFVKGKTGDLALSLLDKNAPPWRKVKVKWACFANP